MGTSVGRAGCKQRGQRPACGDRGWFVSREEHAPEKKTGVLSKCCCVRVGTMCVCSIRTCTHTHTNRQSMRSTHVACVGLERLESLVSSALCRKRAGHVNVVWYSG